MADEKVPKAFFTIMLTSGKEIRHECDMPQDYEGILEFLREQVGEIVNALVDNRLLSYSNPMVAYNPHHVAAVQMDFLTPDKYQESIQRAMKQPLGFLRSE